MKTWKHVPNALTLLRLLLCPIVVTLFLRREYLPGLVLFAVAAVSDFLDGYIARRYNAKTPLGALLDPVSDKVLSLSFFSLLMALGACPPWFLGLWISLNLLQILGYVVLRVSRGEPVPIQPSRVSKWNTALQFLWIGVLLVDVVLRHSFPRNFHYSLPFHLAGYVPIAGMQIAVFYRYFQDHRQALVPEFRDVTAKHRPGGSTI